MANIKQQKKRVLTDVKRNLKNRIFKSKMKTAIKKANHAIDNNLKNAQNFVSDAIELLDKASQRKIKKVNFVNRNKSRLHKKFNSSLKNEEKN